MQSSSLSLCCTHVITALNQCNNEIDMASLDAQFASVIQVSLDITQLYLVICFGYARIVYIYSNLVASL